MPLLFRPARATSPQPNLELSLRIVSPLGGISDTMSRPVSPELMTFNGQPHVGDWRQMRNCTWCYRLHKKVHPTKRFCAGCDKNFCSDLSGRDCFKLHMVHGIPPLGLDKKGESERAKWGLIKGVDLNHIKSHPNKKGAAKASKKRVAKRALEG